MLTLYGIYYSPWTEKARWALDYHRIAYDYQEYIPLLTTPLLYLKTGKWFSRLTVPLLLDEQQTIEDSLAIVRYADKKGHAEKLIPFTYESEILRLNSLAEQVFRASRAIITSRIENNSAAKEELLPNFFSEELKPYLLPLADVGIAYLKFKYSFGGVPIAQHYEVIRQSLLEVRSLLGKRETFFERFTLADINAALMLHFIKPITKYIPLTPALLVAFTQNSLTQEFADLIEWRDKIYAKYRK